MVMLFAQLKSGRVDRDFWLFDTFEGLPKPTSEHDDARSKAKWIAVAKGHVSGRHVYGNKWNFIPLEVVVKNIASVGYPMEKIRFVKGNVESTLVSEVVLPKKVSLLRLDTDWFDSTLAELVYFYDRLCIGCLLDIDDYCTWGGSRSATNKFFGERGIQLPNRVRNICLAIRKV
eukprot:CAMPEP_0177603746 /NCGR_PEP_ID=MMETSP0419_2-20121207/15698_1 /TAXON_ID=582737 /ORGANISM="Tetraselmis sp., Strain GSL018" /LENGTH=173 /DNA_ID=CAMNT_0019097581 /DNA_START=451 /DNA_END=972 /DNA_ORIENTATION=+